MLILKSAFNITQLIFLTEKLVHISKELELALKICIISANKFEKKIQENFKQVKIL